MGIIIKSITDIPNYSNKLTTSELQDIDKRISDWLASGGKETDSYIRQQLRYAQNIINNRK